MPTAEPILADSLPTQKSEKSQKISFIHLGCPKNLVDTEQMLGLLAADGHQIVPDETEADLVLVNTCAFIDSAQEESVKTLANLAENGKRLLIAGCLAQKFQQDLLDLFPEADAVIGTHDIGNIQSVMRRVQQGERVLATQQDPNYLLQDDTVRQHITLGASVYVKISEGCDYRCTFCIIPTMRGDQRSRTIENVVENVKALSDKGVTEVILVGQDTTSYGKEFGYELADLLEALNKEAVTQNGALQWIRFLYAYPTNVSDRLLSVIADSERIVKYLDCPLQHTHPEILKRMGRPVTDMEALADRMRSKIPNVRLRTSFIVGFPGETEAHYQHLKQTIERVKWDRLGVFEYSDVDTAASQKLDGKVTKASMKARRQEIMAIQQQISYAHNQALVGQTLPVLIDQISASGVLMGRTQWDAPEIDNAVLIRNKSEQPLYPGELVPVKVTSATPYDLKADYVGL